MNIYKLCYTWYEGEYEETLLGKNVESEQFEQDLLKAREFAQSLIGTEIKEGDYRGKGYRIECLPEYYEQFIWFLTSKLGYIQCYFNQDINYYVEDQSKTISINKRQKTINWSELPCLTQT